MVEKLIKSKESTFMISLVLKSFAIFFSIPLVIYSFFLGVLGLGPDGYAPLSWRVIGVICLIDGIMCCMPNKIIIKSNKYEFILVLSATVPIIFILILLLNWIQDNANYGLSDISFMGCIFALMIGFLLGPLSYLFFKKSLRK